MSKSVSDLDNLFSYVCVFALPQYFTFALLRTLPWQKLALNAKGTFQMCLKSTQLLKGAVWGHLSIPSPDVPYTE